MRAALALHLLAIASLTAVMTSAAQAQVCVGDCNVDGRVTVAELTTIIAGVLDDAPRPCPTACAAEACLYDLVLAVRYALTACPTQQADGGACALDADCRSGRCRERCCAAACGGDDCCDASGTCVPALQCAIAAPPGAPCMDDGVCDSGVCDNFDAICCIRRCNESTEYCTLDGRCREFSFRQPNGGGCDSDFDCLSGHCAPSGHICRDAAATPRTSSLTSSAARR